MTRLEQVYRLLLLAYPRRYRRARGAEMLTTLLEAARPLRREMVGLLWGGVRARFRLPGGGLIRAAGFVSTVCTDGGYVAIWYRMDPSRAVALARTRLGAAGWQTGSDGAGRALHDEGQSRRRDRPGDTTLRVIRAEPPWMRPITWAGLVLGALIGWLLTGWAARRLLGRTPGWRAVAGTFLGLAVFFLSPVLPWTAVLLWANLIGGVTGPVWIGFVFFGVRLLGNLGTLRLIAVLGLAALAGPARPPTTGPGFPRVGA
jgi:hypothetical protein